MKDSGLDFLPHGTGVRRKQEIGNMICNMEKELKKWGRAEIRGRH